MSGVQKVSSWLQRVLTYKHDLTYSLLRQPRFIWESGTWGPVPRWLSPPDITVIESLSRSHLQLHAGYDIAVAFFAEGAFNKLYTINVAAGNVPGPRQYIFRVTSPVEPFYKTASEVATLSYIREYTSIPVPRVIAHCSTTDNELGCEWILMEKVPGVTLDSIWSGLDMEMKNRVTKLVASFVVQLRGRRRFKSIGNLYFSKDLGRVGVVAHVVPTEDEKYVLGPIVIPYMFAGGRKLRVSRNLGPYSNDAEYMTALAASGSEEMKLLLSADAHLHDDFDEDLAEDAEDIMEVLDGLQTISATLFPSRPCRFALHHGDLSLSNILIDPVTHEITGIVDWECVGTRPHWQDPYPTFLTGPEVEETEPLASGDTDPCRVERWENWEKMRLRSVFDRLLGEVSDADDGKDGIRREFREQLDWVDISQAIVRRWMKGYDERRLQMEPEAA